jgi:hypothetical protein|uniref:Uncharacterized protein n=1 Tax=Sipha flava TaxID=143950 RepID=A0A2S2R1L4_9HEMI
MFGTFSWGSNVLSTVTVLKRTEICIYCLKTPKRTFGETIWRHCLRAISSRKKWCGQQVKPYVVHNCWSVLCDVVYTCTSDLNRVYPQSVTTALLYQFSSSSSGAQLYGVGHRSHSRDPPNPGTGSSCYR